MADVYKRQALHLAVEHILLSDAELCRSIRIVEVGDVQRAGFIVNRTLDQRQALADTVDLGFGADHRAHSILVLHVDFRNRRDVDVYKRQPLSSSAAQNDRFGTQIAFLYKNIIQFSRKNYNDEIRFPRIAPLSAA